jgi:tetratricopeptide (TPR) repeat protein
MEEPKAESVASQTEVPVSSVPPQSASSNNKFNLSKIDKKVFIGVGVLILIILAGSGFLLFANNSDNKVSNNGYVASFNAGNYEKAQGIVDKGLSLNADNPALLAEKIQINSTIGNQTGEESKTFQESKPYIDKLIASNPTDASSLIVIGYSYETAGDYEQALKYYDQAIKADPNSSSAWFHRGHVLAFLGKESDSSESYDKAKNLDSDNPFVLMVEANKLFGQQDYQKSYETFKKASEIPGISQATKSEALTGASLARGLPTYVYISEALQISKAAVDANPNFSPALSAYGYNLYMTGDKKGIDYVNKAIQANPRISRNYYLLGMFARGEKKFIDSINYTKQALERVDNDNTIVTPEDKAKAKAKMTYELAKTYSISDQNADVLSMLQQAVALDPSIKSTIIKDFQTNHFYQSLAQNGNFQSLITL